MIKVFALMAFFCFFSNPVKADDVYGLMMVVKGDVSVVTKDHNEQKAHIGLKVYPGDTIVTKKDARAKVVMVDKNIINVSPESKFQIAKYEYNPGADKKGALLNVIYGKIRTTVNQKYDGEKNTFRVKTSTAVAGVRGTDFLVSYNETTNTSKVVTFRGRVEVGNRIDSMGRIQGAVFVTPGQYTVASAHQVPTRPSIVPPQEFSHLNQQSSVDTYKDNGDSRKPSSLNHGPNNGSSAPSNAPGTPNGNANPNDSGRTNLNAPQAAGTLGEMGENISAPAIAVPPPAAPKLPFTGTVANNPCPNGNCMPAPVDPNLLKGNTKVIVNLQP